MTIGIVGYGVVGKALAKLFGYDTGKAKVQIYDQGLAEMAGVESRKAIQDSDLVFVAVPTPEKAGGSCDLSAVEDVVSWVEPPICLKSTVPPGTVEPATDGRAAGPTAESPYAGPWHSNVVRSHGRN